MAGFHSPMCVRVLELCMISIETLCSSCLIWLFLEQCDVRISMPLSLIKQKAFYNPTNERIKSIASTLPLDMEIFQELIFSDCVPRIFHLAQKIS